jgi:DNA-binding IclR family transcriptional regulator
MAEPINRSLARGLEILALLSEAPKGLALHEITRALALPKSSAFNLIRTLLDQRFVWYDADSAHYRLSLRALELGSAALRGATAGSLLRHHMREISRACNETVHCGVPDGADVVYVDKIDSTHSVRMTSRIGARMPLYCTAMGRAILACAPEEEARAMLDRQTFQALTPRTIVSREALLDELAMVRAQGYAIEWEETNENVCCVGVAIRAREGPPQYAISISAPIFRADPAQLARFAELLLGARGQIERELRLLQ